MRAAPGGRLSPTAARQAAQAPLARTWETEGYGSLTLTKQLPESCAFGILGCCQGGLLGDSGSLELAGVGCDKQIRSLPSVLTPGFIEAFSPRIPPASTPSARQDAAGEGMSWGGRAWGHIL